MLFADILLPLKLNQAYSYSIPQHLEDSVRIGKRVLVSFGKNKFYAGIVTKIHNQKPQMIGVKTIEEVLDTLPILSTIQLSFWKWLSDYYMCTMGEVMDLALPSYFKLSSERFFKISDICFPESYYEWDVDEEMLYDAISSSGQLSSKEIKDVFGKKQGWYYLQKMIDRGWVEPVEVLRDKYQARFEKFILIQEEYQEGDRLNLLFDELQKKSPQQWKVLITYFSTDKFRRGVLKSKLIETAQVSPAIVKSLLDKNILIEETRQVDRFHIEPPLVLKRPDLSPRQDQVYTEIENIFANQSVALLRGLTGSGKTEIYIRLIQEYLSKGKTCLLILPEIALTQQIVSRLNAFFGVDFVIYHSLISHNKRYEIWNKVYSGEIKFLVGTRSALFLPFQRLDLAIIDEEHDMSLKQMDSNPRFHARDSLIQLSQSLGTKILLGSATPSIESVLNAKQGKYGYVELLERFGNAKLPKIELVSLIDPSVSIEMKSFYSKKLLDEIEQTVQRGEQAILFQNRRGYSPYIQCDSCGFVQKCDQCDVRLTYHSIQKVLICHYCSRKYRLQSQCLECKSPHLKTKGLGTQKVEEEIQLFIPNLKVGRLDMDTAGSVTKIEKVLNDFRKSDFDVLIGTQMVSKGLDFENLTLVGVIQADVLFSFIDYKNDEKAYQILSQVSGRVGRGEKEGKVLIQTTQPNNKVLQWVLAQNWEEYVDAQLKNREEFIYPPYCKMLKIVIRHLKEDLVKIYGEKLTSKMKDEIKSIVLGPVVPPISRIRNQYIREIIVKLPRNKDLQLNKNKIREIIDYELMTLDNKNFSIDVYVDV